LSSIEKAPRNAKMKAFQQKDNYLCKSAQKLASCKTKGLQTNFRLCLAPV